MKNRKSLILLRPEIFVMHEFPSRQAAKNFNFFKYESEPGFCEKHPNNPNRFTFDDSCTACTNDRLREENAVAKIPRTLKRAIEVGAPYYTSITARICRGGPHLWSPSTVSGRCFHCQTQREDGRAAGTHHGSRDEATAIDARYYFDGKPCRKGHLSARYTRSGACMKCARGAPSDNAVNFVDREGEVDRQTHRGTKQSAIAVNARYYSDGKACRRGHLSPRLTATGACMACLGKYVAETAEAPSNNNATVDQQVHKGDRWSAVAAGLRYYFDGKACRRGHLSPRYTNGGACMACLGKYVAPSAPAVEQTWQGDRKTAAALGFKYYSDGKACRRGHLSPRYTSTGNCIECMYPGRRTVVVSGGQSDL